MSAQVGVVRAIPVMGQFDREPPGRQQGGVSLERLRVAGVQTGVLAGQQIVVDGLADQGVPERVPVAVDDEDVRGDRGPQRPVQRRVVQPGHGGEQRVLDMIAAAARHAEEVLGVARRAPHTGQQQVAQRLGQLADQVAVRAVQ
jgi:hypothetical protein